MTSSLPSKRFTTVKGRRLAHVEMGSGDPIGQAVAAWMSRLGGSQ